MLQRAARQAGAGILLAALLATIFAGGGSAHNVVLLEASPAPGETLQQAPAEVYVKFNEEMKTGASTLIVYDAGGNQMDKGDGGVDLDDPDHASMRASLPEGLPPGAYTVRWQVVLLDGDPTEGSFQFFIGSAAATQAAQMQAALSPDEPATPSVSKQNQTILLAGGVFGLLVLAGGAIFFARQKINRR